MRHRHLVARSAGRRGRTRRRTGTRRPDRLGAEVGALHLEEAARARVGRRRDRRVLGHPRRAVGGVAVDRERGQGDQVRVARRPRPRCGRSPPGSPRYVAARSSGVIACAADGPAVTTTASRRSSPGGHGVAVRATQHRRATEPAPRGRRPWPGVVVVTHRSCPASRSRAADERCRRSRRRERGPSRMLAPVVGRDLARGRRGPRPARRRARRRGTASTARSSGPACSRSVRTWWSRRRSASRSSTGTGCRLAHPAQPGVDPVADRRSRNTSTTSSLRSAAT